MEAPGQKGVSPRTAQLSERSVVALCAFFLSLCDFFTQLLHVWRDGRKERKTRMMYE